MDQAQRYGGVPGERFGRLKGQAMTSFLKLAGMGAALAATALTAAVPAEAQRYGGYRHHDRRGDAGLAVAAGIAGLAVGTAIASRNDRFYGPGYGYRGGFRGGYYGPRYNGFYDRGFYDRGYYGPRRGFYGPGYGGFGGRCFVTRRWDPYYGAPVRVRVCN